MQGPKKNLRILALEPYYGGSHKDFLDQWAARSQHEWTLLTLPPFKWRWRMRHSALHFAEQISDENRYDVIVCSDMLNLAEFLSFCPSSIRDLPTIAYFHENQLTYPLPEGHRRDYHTAYMNFTTALSATETWFNSAFHRDQFFAEMRHWLKRMPDFPPVDALERAQSNTHIMHPPIHLNSTCPPAEKKSPHILWAARFDYDKNIELFRDALRLLPVKELNLHISIIGEQFHDEPPIFAETKEEFSDHILHWGYQESRAQYEAVLASADIVVSTAIHEFFGMAIMEAVASGCAPILPKRLAYPELFDIEKHPERFYDGSAEQLAQRIQQHINNPDRFPTVQAVGQKHLWPQRIGEYDQQIQALTV